MSGTAFSATAAPPDDGPGPTGRTPSLERTPSLGRTPSLTVRGFSGPLEALLALARARQIDLAGLPVAELIDQLAAALGRASGAVPLGELCDWVVMAAGLLLLRSRLLLPEDAPGRQAADAAATRLRDGLLGLNDAQSVAAWLDRRPQLGRDVFSRGRPEGLGMPVAGEFEVDVIAFLWASLALFDDDLPDADLTPRYRPRPPALHDIGEARARILRLLAEVPHGQSLGRLLPAPETDGMAGWTGVRARSRWTSTFAASLELAKEGRVLLHQAEAFGPIEISPAPSDAAA